MNRLFFNLPYYYFYGEFPLNSHLMNVCKKYKNLESSNETIELVDFSKDKWGVSKISEQITFCHEESL